MPVVSSAAPAGRRARVHPAWAGTVPTPNCPHTGSKPGFLTVFSQPVGSRRRHDEETAMTEKNKDTAPEIVEPDSDEVLAHSAEEDEEEAGCGVQFNANS
jgi:hypothetical protein